MTNRTEAGAEKSFISTLLPWMIAGALAIVYLVTINHWISFKNIRAVERATGLAWTPDVYTPLFVLVTSPFHWLPASLVPLAMNLFSVVCAFFVLVLLARCVALMPHDRTQRERDRVKDRNGLLTLPSAWLPPVLAVLVFGLQLTFWENATSLSSAIFDLLLFAYAVRCLLEYRIDKRESWLLRAAVVYAAAATDSWVLIALFPFFLASIVWMMGLSFFQLRFVSRLFLCILAGLLFYLYLPLVHHRSNGYFWLPLRQNVMFEFSQVLIAFRHLPHPVQILLILTSIVPVFVIGIRWKSSFGDTSELGVTLATWVLHLANIALLLVCLWAAFDTGFSLRDPAGKFRYVTNGFLINNRDNFLPLYFLSALSIGYLAGYFLLIFKPAIRRGRPVTNSDRFSANSTTAVIYALLVLVPIGLLFKNFPAIRLTNGPMLQNYASALTEKLPSEGVVMSDKPEALILARSWLARSGKSPNLLFLDTHSLKSLAYYRYQTRQHPEEWPQVFTNVPPNADPIIGDFQLAKIVRDMSLKHPIYYLQPSFGYYFEIFYPVPHGLVNELRHFASTNVITPPPLSEAEFAENEAFWKQHDAELDVLAPAVSAPPPDQKPGLRQRWLNKMHIPFEKNATAEYLGDIYSRAVNTWGAAAQRMGRLESAGAHFDQAVQLAPENFIASANLEFNKKLRKGERVPGDDLAGFQERFGNSENWDRILSAGGSFDDPTGCLAEGIVFHRGHLDRQAAQNFQRSLTLAPDGLLARLWLSRVYVVLRKPENALTLVNELKAHSSRFADVSINPADVFQVELAATYVSEAPDQIDHLVRTTLSQKPPDPLLVDTVVQVAAFYRDYTNALLALDKQLQLSPNNLTSLINKGYLELQVSNFNGAIPPLSRAISLAPTNATAIFCRAVSYFETGKLDEAQKDYDVLRQMNPKAYPAYHGLAEVALKKNDTNAAIQWLQLDLTNAPPNSPEANDAADKLKKLRKPSA